MSTGDICPWIGPWYAAERIFIDTRACHVSLYIPGGNPGRFPAGNVRDAGRRPDRPGYDAGVFETATSFIMQETVIRNSVTAGDVDAIVRLHLDYYCREHGFSSEFEEYVRNPLAGFAARNSSDERIWIVEQGGEVKGSVALVRNSGDESQLRWFIMHGSLQGRGLGMRMVADLVRFAANKCYRRIVLWTVSGLHGAIHIYEKNGFVQCDERDHVVWGLVLKELKYRLDLMQ